MIGNLTVGSGASGLVGYITSSAGHEIGGVEYRNLAAETPQQAAYDMRMVARLSTRCEKPYLHLSLAWHPTEQPTTTQMFNTMDLALTKLGLQDHQAVYAIHAEKDHWHLHAAVNRVDVEGRAWNTWRSHGRVHDVTRELEEELGFEKALDYARTPEQRSAARLEPTPRERRVMEQTGQEPLRIVREAALLETRERVTEQIGMEAKEALRSAKTWADAHERFAAQGLALEAYRHPKTDRIGLQIVEIATGERVAASALGSDYGRGKLENRLGPFEERDTGRFQALERVLEPGADREPIRERQSSPAGQERPKTPTLGPGDDSLWSEYQADRAHRLADAAGARELAWEHHRDRVGAIRAIESSAWRQAARSVAAYELAAARSEIHDQHGVRPWRTFVTDKAREGDERAIAQIARWNRSEERGLEVPFGVTQPEDGSQRTTPAARALRDLHYRVDERTGDVVYQWRDGRDAFTDHGNQIALHDPYDGEAIRSALELARAKWGRELRLQGDERFKKIATEIATDLGLAVTNPEMQSYQSDLIAQRELANHRERLLGGRELESIVKLEDGIHDATFLGEIGGTAIVQIRERRFAFRGEDMGDYEPGDSFAIRYERDGRQITQSFGDRATLEAELEEELEQAQEPDLSLDDWGMER